MTESIQLELNLQAKSQEQMTFDTMQKQIDLMYESMGKVRRKLFGEMGEIKKKYADLEQQHELLKIKLMQYTKQKTEWDYEIEGSLFDVKSVG